MTIPYRKKSIPTHKKESFSIKIFEVEQDGQKVLVARVQAEKFYRHFMKTYAKVGMEGTLTLELKKPKRSVAQNNFYWVYMDLVSLSSGHTPQELHIWAKGKFLSKGITEIFGDKVRKVDSTTDLNRNEFGEFMARIELATGIPIPDPEPFNIGLTMDEYRRLKLDQQLKYEDMKANKTL